MRLSLITGGSYNSHMDDVLLRKVSRQLKLLNFVVSFFGLLILASFVVSAVLLFKAVTFARSEATKIDNLQKQATQSLNVKQQLCSDSSLQALLQSTGTTCR